MDLAELAPPKETVKFGKTMEFAPHREQFAPANPQFVPDSFRFDPFRVKIDALGRETGLIPGCESRKLIRK